MWLKPSISFLTPYFHDIDDPDWPAKSREEKLSSVVAGVKGSLSVSAVARSRLVRVSFTHAVPEKAALITNTLTDSFINNSVSRKFNATAYARDFLETRLAAVKTSLEAAERDLVEYAARNNLIQVGRDDDQEAGGSLDMTALVALDGELTRARTDRVQAEQQYQQSTTHNFTS